ncbi:MAG: DUF1365 family protein [Sulfurimonas sp.]|jgi:DUF1365 family protein
MSHLFYEGEVYHKRFAPKIHEFTYPFFLLDIDVGKLSELKNRLFSLDRFNLFSFSAKDHFGTSKDFHQNIAETLNKFNLPATEKMHFITLPKIFNYVFNPISILMLFSEDNQPTNMLVEVHNYNGGRVVYPVKLEAISGNKYKGSVLKDMYVSPFLKRDGLYKFVICLVDEKLSIHITLYEDNEKKLIAFFKGSSKEFSSKSVKELFCRHTFLTFWVVTRTLFQSFKLWLKGLKFVRVTPQDEIRRY